MEDKDKNFWGGKNPPPEPPPHSEPVVSVELTPDQIDEIDQRAEDEEALFGETHDVSVKVPTIETEDETKIPVSYETAEEAVIAMFIDDDDAAMTIAQSGLRDIHFQKRKNKTIFPIVLNVRFGKGVCNYDLLADALEKESMQSGQSVLDFIGGLSELSNIVSALPPVVDLKVVQGYIDIVFEQYKLAKVKETARYINGMRKFEEGKLVEKLSTLQQIIADNSMGQHGLVPLDVLVTDAYTRYMDRRDNPVPGIETGFYWLNKNKVISRKRTCVIGARTSIGKSVMVSNIITKMLLNDYKVLLFTPELDRQEYVDRLMCAEARVSIDDWKAGTISNEDNDRYGKAQDKILAKAQNLHIEDKGSQSCGFILNSVKKHMLNHQIDIVVIDYLQKLRYWGDNTKRSITDMMEKFCSFAKDNNIAFIVVSQLRRSSEAEPLLNDLKESGDIENFADSVILLHRASIVNHSERHKGWYMVAKNRQGPVTDRVELVFTEDCLKFTEKDIPQDGVTNQGSLIGGYDEVADEDRPTEQTVVAEVLEKQGKI